MATYVKYQKFIDRLCKKEIDLSTDTIKILLSNTAPNVATHLVKADAAEISAGNGYTAGGYSVTASYNFATGTVTIGGTDITITASGGAMAAFRYAIMYDDTHASDALIAYWDYGSSITLNAGESILLDIGASLVAFS